MLALEDKIVQRAMAEVLTAIYDVDSSVSAPVADSTPFRSNTNRQGTKW